jgi:alpha-tubulin suppressor-like RCC1 family protein
LNLFLENNVYSWGKNDSGQLGHGDQKNRSTPTKIDFFDGMKIVQISCGDSHCIALQGKSKLLIFRKGKYLYMGKK